MHTINVNELNFREEVIHSTLPVLVDFWAPWSAPCYQMAPVLDELAIQYFGRFKIVKINTDETRIGMRYDIMGIPSLLIFKNGHVMEYLTGPVPKSIIAAKLAYYSEAIAFYN